MTQTMLTRSGPIFLIDDDPDDIELIQRALRKSEVGNSVVVHTDGAAAIAALRHAAADPEPPVLVLLDLKMPKMDGFEVLRALRAHERTHRLPVVIFTSSREEQDLVLSYDLGASSYVRKPVEFTELMEATRILGLYWLTLNEPAPAVR